MVEEAYMPNPVVVALFGNRYEKVAKLEGERFCQVPAKLEEALVNEFTPENVLLSPRSVDDANLQVVVEKVYALPFPSTATPPVPMPVKYGLPETVRAVVEAYGKVEAVEVVAVK